MHSLTTGIVERTLKETLPAFQLTSQLDQNLGFGYLFYGFARLIRPELTVVVGSKGGFAPVLFGMGVHDNAGHSIGGIDCYKTELESLQKGTVHFIDPSYSVHRNQQGHWYGEGRWDNAEKVAALWSSFALGETLTHYKMTSHEYRIKKLSNDSKIDLLYIDGDHSYEGIMSDLVGFHQFLSPRAMVLAHDVDPRCKEAKGFDVLRDLPSELYEYCRIPLFPGLAILRKRSTEAGD
jgi:hypothetical protein